MSPIGTGSPSAHHGARRHAPGDAGEVGHDFLELLVRDVAEGRVVREGDDGAAVLPTSTWGESKAALSVGASPSASVRFEMTVFCQGCACLLGKTRVLFKEPHGMDKSDTHSNNLSLFCLHGAARTCSPSPPECSLCLSAHDCAASCHTCSLRLRGTVLCAGSFPKPHLTLGFLP